MFTNVKKQIFIALIACLTLGLAPFGDPHILGKIKWVRGGAIGMKPMDWFDLFLHGLPWVYLLIVLILFLLSLRKSN